MKILSLVFAAIASVCVAADSAPHSKANPAAVTVSAVEPTPLFPKPAEGRPLRQLARLRTTNPGAALAAVVRVTLGTATPETQAVAVPKGKGSVEFLVPEIAAPTPVKVELLDAAGKILFSKQQQWQPPKKWTLYCCSYSHQDLGFGDYPHRLRTSIRHENIRLPLQFCRETDDRPDDSKYRFNIETSEPITSFISFHGKEAARELARRMREGRIALGGLHNTANTEQLSNELLARLFYMSGRYAVDLLGVPPDKTMQIDDVVGLTWALPTYGAEADLAYFFHGFNPCGHCLRPAESEPAFLWEGSDGRGRVLMRSEVYGSPVAAGSRIGNEQFVLGRIAACGPNWPYDALLVQEGADFQLASRHFADQIHAWNAKWAWPRMVCATFDKYFNAIAKEAGAAKVKTFTGDSNNQWSDQDYAAARATGLARRLSEELPATETLASVAQVLAGGGDQWINTFQAYHRLLQYFEHTNAKDNPRGNMAWYETELEENREMVEEAAEYQQAVFESATHRLNSVIPRRGDQNVIVFNPLPCRRSDVVRIDLPLNCVFIDEATGARIDVQDLPDGMRVFVASDVPATGYRVYRIDEWVRPNAGGTRRVPDTLESRFYRIEFDRTSGAITSLFDKTVGVELVEKNAPHGFNEYLYEFRTQTTGIDFDSRWGRMEKADAVTVSRGPVADVLTVKGKAEGVRSLEQTVILYHDLPRVDFGVRLDKAPFRGSFPRQHEAVFVALPLNVPNFTIRHELPGCVAKPYRQQFEGSATDHFAVRSFTDFSNDKYGVTVSPIEGSLVCYGEPTSSPIVYGREDYFKRDQKYPAKSRLYLYLLNNMFDVNIAADQRGPVSFRWALRGHAGDWRAGGADRFGRGVLRPLMAWRADGENKSTLPSSAGFFGIDVPNITCSVLKPAEANGRGFIIRLNETTGRETTATVSLPMLPKLESAVATSLVENDRAEKYPLDGNSFRVTLPKFGVKTVRVTCPPQEIAAKDFEASGVADNVVTLRWEFDRQAASHFNVYRDTQPDCPPTQLNFIGQSSMPGFFRDTATIHAGGWLRSCLRPQTTYYYRIVPVDRANNPGKPSPAMGVNTSAPGHRHRRASAVEGLHAILISPISNDNFVNLLFRTACEPDVTHYEIHRGTRPDFAAGKATLVGTVKSDDIPPRSGGYGESKIIYKVKEYDHATFADHKVEPSTTYYYKVRAVDAVGKSGEFSKEVSITTKGPPLGGCKVAAQSTYAPEYAPELALDGDPDPYRAWISKPYGGGIREKPNDVWWSLEFPPGKTLTLSGVKIFGDHRDVIPLQRGLQVQIRVEGQWKTVGQAAGANEKDLVVKWPRAVTTGALRVFVPAADLPKSLRADVDGIVRICELLFILPDRREAAPRDVFDPQ